MNQIITRNEILEQYDLLPLEYRFFLDGVFVFSGCDKFDNHVSIYVSLDGIVYVPSVGIAYIREFRHLGLDDLRILIINKNLELIYKD